MVPDPWSVLAATDLVVVRAPIAEPARYYHRQRTIVLRRGLRGGAVRAALWHELVHARRGDIVCIDGVLHRRQEASVDREAARWAIPLADLERTVRLGFDDATAADELETTVELLTVRRSSLHPAERGRLQLAASMSEGVA